jgi:very-short-patch-repair endonuclease
LEFVPFRGTSAVADGLLTPAQLRSSAWVRLLNDVYIRRGIPLDHRAWCDAVALTLPAGAAIGGLSAAYLWGVDLVPPGAPVTVVAPRARSMRRTARVRIHYTTFGEDDVTTFAGLPVTTSERTAFDLGRRASRSQALVAVDALLHRKVLRIEDLRSIARERLGWPGAAQLAEVLRLSEPLSESPMETRLRLQLLDAGLPTPQAQFEVRDGSRLIARVDLAWPDLRLAAEYEGDHHREQTQFRRDIARLNALRTAGWTVIRLTADDVLRRPAPAIRLITTAMRALRPD